MATINLLPTELTLKGKDKVLVQGIRKFVSAGLLVLIIGALIIAGYLVFISFRIRSSLSNEEVLKQEISSFQETEQGLFFIKDRISKIKSVLAKESSNEQISVLSGFLQTTQGEFSIFEVQVSIQRTEISLVFPTSIEFGNFYKALIESNLYSNIILKSFSLNPSLGYLATFELIQNE